MRTFIPLVTVLFVSPFLSTASRADVLCEYAAFTAPAVYHHLTNALAARGVALVPARYLADSSDDDLLLALREGYLYGQVRFSQTLAGAETSFLAESPQGFALATAESETYPCREGWCRATEIRTLIDGGDSAIDAPSIRISQEPSYGVRYLVYGERVGVTSWRSQYNDRLDWLVQALSNDATAVALEAYAPTQKLYLALAAEPAMVPYLGVIDISTGVNGALVVTGRVPHGIYNLIIDAALRLGYYNIRPNMIIDSGAMVIPRSTDPDLFRCFGW